MIRTDVENSQNGETQYVSEQQVQEKSIPEYEFGDYTNESSYGVENFSNISEEEAAKEQRKRSIKADISSTLVTLAINSIPIITSYSKHKKEPTPTPFKVNKTDLTKLVISTAIPAIKAIDTLFFGSKLQNLIEKKTSFKYSDIQNVVNIVSAYPGLHKWTTGYMEDIGRAAAGKPVITRVGTYKRDAILSLATMVTPYVTDKFSDNRLTFTEKFSSVMPVKIFGGLFRKVVSFNPKLQQAYDVGAAALKVASYGTNTISTAVRPTQGSTINKTINEFSGVIDFLQDATGISRGRSSYYSQYDNYTGYQGNRGQRWNY